MAKKKVDAVDIAIKEPVKAVVEEAKEATTKTISVFDALSERKILRDRIGKVSTATFNVTAIYDPKTEGVYRGEKASKEKLEEICKGRVQSLEALLTRYEIYSSVIDESNAKTPITIAGKTYTSKASAMAVYGVIDQKIKIYESLKTSITSAISTIAAVNAKNLSEDSIADYISRLGVELTTEAVEELTNQYKKRNTLELIDPCNMSGTIEDILEELYEFKDRFNTEMNKSNLETFVEIPL